MRDTSRLSRIARRGTPSWSSVRTVGFAVLLVVSMIAAPVQLGVSSDFSPVETASAQEATHVWNYTGSGQDITALDTDSSIGRIYAVNSYGVVHALNSNGAKVWNYSASGSSGLATNEQTNEIYVSGTSDVEALNASGGLLWTYSAHTADVRDVAVDNSAGRIYTASEDGTVHALNSTGSQMWTYTPPGQAFGVAVNQSTGTIYTVSEGTLTALDTNGTKLWTLSYSETYVNTVEVDQSSGNIYTGDNSNNVRKVAPGGTSIWSKSIHSADVRDLTFDEDASMLYSAGDDNDVHATAPNGTTQWTYSEHANNVRGVGVNQTSSTVYSGSWDNEVHAFEGTEPSAYTVSGTVTNSSGSGLADATVSADSGESTTTDSSGSYSFLVASGDRELTADADGYGTNTTTVSVTSDTTADFELAPYDVTGTVRDQNGDPVAGATVKAYGFNYANYTGTQPEIDRKISNQVENITNPIPSEWDGSVTIDGDSGIASQAESADVNYVAVHTAEDWEISGKWGLFGDTRQLDPNPELAEPGVEHESGSALVLSLWNPADESLVQDQVDNDLPGETTSGEVVVEQLAAAGETDGPETYATEEFVKISGARNLGSKTHEAVVLSGLQDGIYRVYPKGQREAGYLFAVAPNGDVLRLRENIVADARNDMDELAEQSKALQDAQEQNKITKPMTTTTDKNGEFGFNFSSQGLDEVSMVAFKGPDTLSVDPDNPPSQRDIARHFDRQVQPALNDWQSADTASLSQICEGSDLSVGAGQSPAGVTRVEVPQSGVIVDTVGAEVPKFTDATNQFCYRADFLDYLNKHDLDNMSSWAIQRLEDLTESEIRELRKKAYDIARGSEYACHEFARQSGVSAGSECSGGFSDDNGDNQLGVDTGVTAPGGGGTVDEIADQIDTIDDVVDDAPGNVGSDEGETVTDNGTVSKEWFFDTDLSKSNVLVRADYSNGTSTTMTTESEFVSVDTRLGQSDVVHLTEFPLGANDPAMVSFSVIVAGPDGVGSETSPVRNPTFNGNVPQLESVRLSTVAPGPDDRVGVRLNPAEAHRFGKLTNVTVTAPNGTELPAETITDGRSTSFSTASAGVHHIKLEFTNDDGTTFVESVRVNAGQIGRELPPTVKAHSGPTGIYAITSGLDSASIDVSSGGEDVTASAILAQGADVPASVSVHTGSLDVASGSTTTFRLVRGDTRQSVRRSVSVRFYARPLGETPTLYRQPGAESQPLPRDGDNQYASVMPNSSQTVIETYTTGDGTVSIKTNADPSLVERTIYRVRLSVPWLPTLSTTALPTTALPTGFLPSGGLALLGAGLVLGGRRRWFN